MMAQICPRSGKTIHETKDPMSDHEERRDV